MVTELSFLLLLFTEGHFWMDSSLLSQIGDSYSARAVSVLAAGGR